MRGDFLLMTLLKLRESKTFELRSTWVPGPNLTGSERWNPLLESEVMLAFTLKLISGATSQLKEKL